MVEAEACRSPAPTPPIITEIIGRLASAEPGGKIVQVLEHAVDVIARQPHPRRLHVGAGVLGPARGRASKLNRNHLLQSLRSVRGY